MRIDDLCGLVDQSSFTNCASQREISLLEVLYIELQSIETCLDVNDVMHLMNNRLGGYMVFAPYRRRHSPNVAVDIDDVELIPTRSLDRSDIKSQYIASLVCAFNMHCNRLGIYLLGSQSWDLPGALHEWQLTHAPLLFLHNLHTSSYLAVGIDGIPSEGSKALAFPNFTSGVNTAQVTWTQLLFAVLFSGSRGSRGLFISSCFFLK